MRGELKVNTLKPFFTNDFERLLFYQTNRFASDLSKSTNNVGFIGGGVVFDSSMQRFVLHGTTIASFFVEGGKTSIVVSDGKVSEGPLLQPASLEFNKLIEVDNTTVMAISGSVGFAMLYARMLNNWVETMERIREEKLDTRSKVNMLSRILRENLSLALSGMLVIPILTTYDDKHGPRIFMLTPDGSVVSKKTYAISGSGKVNEGGLLSDWNVNMSKEDGIELAKKLVKNASKLDSATGGRIFIKIVSGNGIESVDGGWTND